MKVIIDGWFKYQIHDISEEELDGILRMIGSASLNERRQFDNLKKQIERTKEIQNGKEKKKK